MKKIFTSAAIVLSLFASVGAFAQMKNAGQDAGTNKGDVLFDFGIGFGGGDYNYEYYNHPYNGNNGNWNGNGWNNYSGNNKIQIPTISLALQKAFWEDITIGGQIAFNAFGNEYNYQKNDGYYQHSKYSQTNTFIMARGEYHFGRLIGLDRKFDLYAGVLAGMRISMNKQSETYEGYDGRNGGSPWQQNYNDYTSTNAGPTGGPFGGFRLYFANNVSVYAELGWAITNFRTGIAWRL
jgi:hypothetical protein